MKKKKLEKDSMHPSSVQRRSPIQILFGTSFLKFLRRQEAVHGQACNVECHVINGPGLFEPGDGRACLQIIPEPRNENRWFSGVGDHDAVGHPVIVDLGGHGGLPVGGECAGGLDPGEIGIVEEHKKAASLAEVAEDDVLDHLGGVVAAIREVLLVGWELQDETIHAWDLLLSHVLRTAEYCRHCQRVQSLQRTKLRMIQYDMNTLPHLICIHIIIVRNWIWYNIQSPSLFHEILDSLNTIIVQTQSDRSYSRYVPSFRCWSIHCTIPYSFRGTQKARANIFPQNK